MKERKKYTHEKEGYSYHHAQNCLTTVGNGALSQSDVRNDDDDLLTPSLWLCGKDKFNVELVQNSSDGSQYAYAYIFVEHGIIAHSP